MGDNSRCVVFCRCERTQLADPGVRAQVLRVLSHTGGVEEVGDLCGLLARRDERVARWAAAKELTVVACFARAIRAMFDWAGAPLGGGAKLINYRGRRTDQVLAELGLSDSGNSCEAITTVGPGASPAGDWLPWFPVIDRRLCVDCKQCVSFCLFGVYAVQNGKVIVKNPANCKTNCPACARICPRVAIIFPKHGQGPINGDEVRPEDLKRKDIKVDVSAIAGGDLRSAIAGRSGAASVSLDDLAAKAQESLKRPNISTDEAEGSEEG